MAANLHQLPVRPRPNIYSHSYANVTDSGGRWGEDRTTNPPVHEPTLPPWPLPPCKLASRAFTLTLKCSQKSVMNTAAVSEADRKYRLKLVTTIRREMLHVYIFTNHVHTRTHLNERSSPRPSQHGHLTGIDAVGPIFTCVVHTQDPV